MSTVSQLSAIVVGAALVVAACGPSISIRHEDPLEPRVDVLVDNESAGDLEYGEELIVRVDNGFHLVEVFVRGTRESPWSDNGQGWVIYVDEEAHLTLLPTQVEP